ncbi:MAG: effector binding domain-containing protein [Planctomycetes bacterium]|nr:effector binding domain-containing protein [Planctomycetota bacterium]
MKVDIIQRKPAKVAGLHARFISILSADAPANNPIKPLWDGFSRSFQQVPNRVGQQMYGLIYGSPMSERTHPDELNYIAAVEVSSLDGLPKGFVGREVPGGTYARATHAGLLGNLKRTLQVLYREALPAAGLEPVGTEIEVYDQRFKGDSMESEMDILVAVRPAARKPEPAKEKPVKKSSLARPKRPAAKKKPIKKAGKKKAKR